MIKLILILPLLFNIGVIIEEEVKVDDVDLYDVDLYDVFLKQEELVDEELKIPPIEIKADTVREVLFTNYYTDTNTASGKRPPTDFEVNSMGMYTYQGKVVLATANTTRLLYDMPSGFVSNELYDEMVIVFRGIEYDAIVLDVCGMCHWGNSREDLQRVDIFTTHKIMGVERGEVRERNE